MIVCICNNISDRTISQAVNCGMTTMPQLRNGLGVGTCCGKCHAHAKQVLRGRCATNHSLWCSNARRSQPEMVR
jgi:bacterioferritin-associated ferredoxin